MAHAQVGTMENETRTSMEVVAGGSLTGILAGAGACVLAIVGLAGVFPGYLAAIATIAIGAALVVEGASILARFGELLTETGSERSGEASLEGGMTSETIGGLAVVALGVLALLGVASVTLMATALIVLGGALLLGSASNSRLSELRLTTAMRHADDAIRRIAREAVSAATGAQVLLGIATIVLGILAVVGVDSLKLVLVGLLAAGFSEFVSGTALGGKMLAGMRGHA